MTSKQRAYLISLAMKLSPSVQIGRAGLTPKVVENANEALEANELIKINIQQGCDESPKELARMLSERTRSQLVQTIGRKIVLYREGKDDKKKIVLPK